MAAVGSKKQMGFRCIHIMIISKYTFVEFLNEMESCLGTDRLLRPKGGRWFWRGGGGGTILKQAPFWGVNFSLVRNMRGVKFYDTATAV